MMTISFQADSKAKLYEQMISYLGLVPQETAPTDERAATDNIAYTANAEAAELPSDNSNDLALPEEQVETPELKKKVRKARAKKKKDVEETRKTRDAGRPKDAADKNKKIKEGIIIKKSSVSEALQKLNTLKGLVPCKSILEEFDCKRVGDLPEEMYRSFIEKCDAAMAE